MKNKITLFKDHNKEEIIVDSNSKIFVISDLHTRLKYLDILLTEKMSEEDILVLNGDVGFASFDKKSLATYLYIWNLQQQKDLPKIIWLKGNHELSVSEVNPKATIFMRKENFEGDDWSGEIETLGTIFKQEPNLFKPEFLPKTKMELFEYLMNETSFICETDLAIIVHGWLNPNQSFQENIEMEKGELINGYLDGITWGSPAKILKYKEKRELRKRYNFNTEKHINDYYFGFSDIEEYNEKIKEVYKKPLILGHWFNPLRNKSLDIAKWDYLYMIDGGLGYAESNMDLFYFDETQEQMNVLEISETPFKEFKITFEDTCDKKRKTNLKPFKTNQKQ